MIVAIHQPHYLPWLGYLHRMAQADLFILLDHVQFERRNYQNRGRILLDGEARWLTVPVVQRSQSERIIDKLIDHSAAGGRDWGRNHLATMRHAYRQARHFPDYAEALRKILDAGWPRLAELDREMLAFLRDAFEIRTPLALSSELAAEGAKSDLILHLCRAVGARTLLAGSGGSRGYLDPEAFARAGVRIEWHDFRHPAYRQCGAQPFVAGLASLDLLFNCGPQSRSILLGREQSATPQLRAA